MPFLIIWCYQMSEFPAAISSIDSLSLVVNIAYVDSVGLREAEHILSPERLGHSWKMGHQESEYRQSLHPVQNFPVKWLFPPFTDTLCLSLQEDVVGWHLSSVSFIINHYCKNVNHNSYFLNKICLDHPLLQFSVCGWWVICITVMWGTFEKCSFRGFSQMMRIRIQVLRTTFKQASWVILKHLKSETECLD